MKRVLFYDEMNTYSVLCAHIFLMKYPTGYVFPLIVGPRFIGDGPLVEDWFEYFIESVDTELDMVVFAVGDTAVDPVRAMATVTVSGPASAGDIGYLIVEVPNTGDEYTIGAFTSDGNGNNADAVLLANAINDLGGDNDGSKRYGFTAEANDAVVTVYAPKCIMASSYNNASLSASSSGDLVLTVNPNFSDSEAGIDAQLGPCDINAEAIDMFTGCMSDRPFYEGTLTQEEGYEDEEVNLGEEASEEDDYYNNMLILIDFGELGPQVLHIVDYDGTTKKATLSGTLMDEISGGMDYAIWDSIITLGDTSEDGGRAGVRRLWERLFPGVTMPYLINMITIDPEDYYPYSSVVGVDGVAFIGEEGVIMFGIDEEDYERLSDGSYYIMRLPYGYGYSIEQIFWPAFYNVDGMDQIARSCWGPSFPVKILNMETFFSSTAFVWTEKPIRPFNLFPDFYGVEMYFRIGKKETIIRDMLLHYILIYKIGCISNGSIGDIFNFGEMEAYIDAFLTKYENKHSVFLDIVDMDRAIRRGLSKGLDNIDRIKQWEDEFGVLYEKFTELGSMNFNMLAKAMVPKFNYRINPFRWWAVGDTQYIKDVWDCLPEGGI